MYRSEATLAIVIGALAALLPAIALVSMGTLLCFLPLGIGAFAALLGLFVYQTDAPPGREVVTIALCLAVVAVTAPLALLLYGDRSGPPVVLVLPVGYRGPVTLVIDPSNGQEVPLTAGYYEYVIPPSGTLVIRNPGPLMQWHSELARYRDGTRLPLVSRSDSESIGLRGGSYMSASGGAPDTIRYFLGSKAEQERFEARPADSPRQ